MCKNHIRKTIALLSFIITFIIAFPALSGTVLGPKQYVRTSGAPNTFTDTFQSMGGSGSLIIKNGSAAGADRVKGTVDNYTITSAKVYINGTLIFGPSDFKSAVYYMERSVQLNNGTNTLYVELRSSPGSYITAEVTGTVIPPPTTISLDITSPPDGTTLFRPDVNVQGTISNTSGAETGVVVNGITASVFGGQFVANHVPLTESQNTITVTARDANGATAVESITVNAAVSGNFIQLTSYPNSGVAPLEVALRINGSFSITNPVITPTGPGSLEQLVSVNPDEYKYRINTEGFYTFSATVTGPDGNTYTDTIGITVLPLAQIDTLLRAKWAKLENALTNKDIPTALTLLRSTSRDRYQTMLNLVKDQLPAIVAAHADLTLDAIKEAFAFYELNTLENGSISYRVIFVRDPSSGLWLIEEF